MEDKYISKEDNEWGKYNKKTGELGKLVKNFHVYNASDFFQAYFAAWNDFKPSEGLKMKVFIHCIMNSDYSGAKGKEGNIFRVQRVIDSVIAEFGNGNYRMTPESVRMMISRLAKDGHVIRTKVRGEYRINPKYGIKGRITENTYLKLSVIKDGRKPFEPDEEKTDGKNADIHPNKEFDNTEQYEDRTD